MNLEQFLGLYNYWIVIVLMMTGFYIVIARENLIKTVIGLNIFQASVFLLYITMGKIDGGTCPDHSIGHGAGASNLTLEGLAAQQVGEQVATCR